MEVTLKGRKAPCARKPRGRVSVAKIGFTTGSVSTAIEQSLTGAPELGPNGLTGKDGPLSPSLSPSEGERGNTRQRSGESGFMGRMPANSGEGKAACFHCGEPCPDPNLTKDRSEEHT